MLAPCPVTLLKLTQTLRTYSFEAGVESGKTYSRPTQIVQSSSARFGFKSLAILHGHLPWADSERATQHYVHEVQYEAVEPLRIAMILR